MCRIREAVRSAEVTGKIARHLRRFLEWITSGLGHDRLSAVTVREVTAWRDHLAAVGNTNRHRRNREGGVAPMAAATVNNHLAHLSALFSWISAHAPGELLRHGDPTKKVAPRVKPSERVIPRTLSGQTSRPPSTSWFSQAGGISAVSTVTMIAS